MSHERWKETEVARLGPAPHSMPHSAIDVAQAPPTTADKPRWWLHILLFVATALTTTMLGLDQSLGRQAAGDAPGGPGLTFWLDGISYSASILAILFAHEMGHYLTARRYGINASPPYFIPFIGAFGTLGAVIRLKIDRKIPGHQLIRVAAFGPLAGFAVAVPVLFIGMALSDVRPAPTDLSFGLSLGDSLILMLSETVFYADLAEGMEIWLHPMAFAGWAGMFVTALNLLPIGQLDGGHIAYCLFGDRFNRVMPYLFLGLVGMTLFVFSGWLMLCVILLLIGFRHPPMCDDVPVRGSARWVGLATVGLFVLCFAPTPFEGMPTLFELIAP